MTSTIAENIKKLKQQIHQTEQINHLPIGCTKILAVSKQHNSQAILEAWNAGLCDFGENYLQEALVKMQALAELPIQWHYIGAIQRNKTAAIAQHFQWVHTISRFNIAEHLNNSRPDSMPALNVCIQLNLDNEISKTGAHPSEALKLAKEISQLPRLKLRGLMAIPKPEQDINKQKNSFQRLTEYFQEINQQLKKPMDTLSMGMSHDFEAAICAGSTIVRIGTAIFGERCIAKKASQQHSI